ncbi:hypothetical protein DZC34_19665 [Clostridium botulinum]|nr:hypothetical protein DZC34_19665 [Clostridium botulinum]
MKTGRAYTTERRRCKVCGKKTGDIKIFTQSDMRIEIPMCEEHYKNEEMTLAEIYFKSEIFLKEINKLFKKI